MENDAQHGAQEGDGQERDGDDGEDDVDGDPGDVQENRLEGVEADETVLVVGGQDQEEDSG